MRLAWCLGLLLGAAATGQQRSFVACPIVRDTRTVPCFLAEYDGALYFLGVQDSDGPVPQLKHEVLVEGRVAQGPRVCGGIPLQPVSISVMKEVNLACSTLLPAEPGIEAPAASRAAAPDQSAGEFTVLYSFNDDELGPAGIRMVTEAAAYAKRGAPAVRVSGFRATSLLSNGERLVEKAGLAEKRAQNIAALLRGLGVSKVTAEWKNDPEPADGQSDASRRRVTIVVTPGG